MDASTTTTQVNDLYKNLTYLDNYGAQVLLVITITIVLILICSYAYVQSHISALQADWPNQRCKPTVMPFAGLIYKSDPNMTVSEATQQNFEYCNQNTLKEISADALQPITFAINNLNTIAGQTADTLNNSRGMFDKMRTGLQSTTGDIMGRALNVTVPIQQMIISFKDMMGKVQGVMTAALFTSLGSYYTLKALLGSIADILVKCLIALSAMIIVMWLTPFTWGVASAMTAVFVSVSIPLALMVSFMTNTMHVSTSLKLPHAPKRPSCFAGKTLLTMADGSHITIKDVRVGDVLADNNKVTAKLTLSATNVDMWCIHGVVVSDDHLVWHADPDHPRWCRVDQHPDAVPATAFKDPVIYCLNTTKKIIVVNGHTFCDWDELVTGKQQTHFMTCYKERYGVDIGTAATTDLGELTCLLDVGYTGDTELIVGTIGRTIIKAPISHVRLGDIVFMNSAGDLTGVYGIVELNGGKYNLLTYDGCFMIASSSGSSTPDYNDCIDSLIGKLGK